MYPTSCYPGLSPIFRDCMFAVCSNRSNQIQAKNGLKPVARRGCSLVVRAHSCFDDVRFRKLGAQELALPERARTLMPELEQQLQNQDRRSVRQFGCRLERPRFGVGVGCRSHLVLCVQYEKLWLWLRLGEQVYVVTPVY